MKLNVKNILEKDVQTIVDNVYPHIVTNLGPSQYREETPTVEVWNDIYARYSGIPEMRGEDSDTTKAEWKDEDNTIYIYYPNMLDIEDVIRSLLHEYSHSLQDQSEKEENSKLGYDDDPSEIEAHQAEKSWKDYLKYLPDNLNEGEYIKFQELEPSEPNGFSPQLINYLKYIFVVQNPTSYRQFQYALSAESNFSDGAIQSLYLTLLYNCNVYGVGFGVDGFQKLLNDIPYKKYKITSLYEYYVEYNGSYDSWMEEEWCEEEGGEEAYGQRSGERCDCYVYKDIVIERENGDEELVPCEEATDKQKQEANVDGCECEEWDKKEVQVYVYPQISKNILSYNKLDDHNIDDITTLLNQLGDEDVEHVVLMSDTDEQYNTEEIWDNFLDGDEDSIQTLYAETEWVKDEIIDSIGEVSSRLLPKKLTEQDQKGLNPELKVGDIVRVIEVDGEHGRMPERFGVYRVVKVGNAYPLMTKRNRGHDTYYDIEPYPNSLTQFSELDGKSLYRGDTWIYGDIPMANKVDRKTITEQKESKVNPELEIGNSIMVVDTDREVENNSIKYNIPPPELRPEKFTPYTVVKKQSNGSESKHPFRYTLIPEDKLEEYERYEALHNNPLYQKKIGAKLLFPWVHQWIYAEPPQAITEQKESNLNPDLMIGDEILVVSTEGIHDFGAPELYKPYVVVGIKYKQRQNWQGPETDTSYYQIEPLDMTDEQRTGAMLAGGGRAKPLYVFPPEGSHGGSDQWILRKGFLRGENLTEQNEQLKMFTTGQWNFPVNSDEDEIDFVKLKYVEDALPEDVITKIFKMWDKKGIDFSILKLLGVNKEFELVQTMLLKRYLQFTDVPMTVSYAFDCHELTDLFDTSSNDYDMGYIKDYLCGKDEFWEPSEWFQYEWYDGMLDDLDEDNWKTIVKIFGGVSQSVSENLLNDTPQNEDEEALIEKYEEEISDIRHFIIWANNDSHEDAVKSAMIEDIENKLAEHFQQNGQLHTDNNGGKSWVIEGDLRDYVEGKWDNAEDVFQYHHDYMNQTLEDVIIDLGKDYMDPDVIFQLLMAEEYRFWDYCEGKQGECLQPETKFFDGYWSPRYDINEIVADRLTELTYETESIVKPIQEQSSDDDYTTQLDKTPFTPTEVSLMNKLVRKFTRAELRTIWSDDETNLPNKLWKGYIMELKLYGLSVSMDGREGHLLHNSQGGFTDWILSTRFAKWADDNWDEAQKIQDMWSAQFEEEGEEDMGKKLDFSEVTNPVKEWPDTFEVEATEEYWIKEYRHGVVEVGGYGLDNVKDKTMDAWYDWDVDMEYGDQDGDRQEEEISIDSITFLRTLKENKNIKRLVEYYTNHTLNLYELIKYKHQTKNIVSLEELRENIKEYITSNSLNKNILYVNEEELKTYLLNGGIIVEKSIKNNLIIEEPKINTGWWKNLPKKEKKHILEHGLMPIEDEEPKEIPQYLQKLLVVARFTSKGTWGISPSTFLLYMKPDGQVMYVKKSGSLNKVPEQFKVGKNISFGDLLNFENNSHYDLNMKGRLRETYLPTGRKLIERHTIKVTPQKQFYLKSLLKEMEKENIDRLLRIAKDTKMGWQGGPGRLKVFEFLEKLRESGLVNMFQAVDFLHSGSKWLRKYIDLHQPESLESIDEYEDSEVTINHKETIQYLLDNADKVRDVLISNVLAKAELKGDDSLEGATRLMRPAAMDMVRLWAGHYVK